MLQRIVFQYIPILQNCTTFGIEQSGLSPEKSDKSVSSKLHHVLHWTETRAVSPLRNLFLTKGGTVMAFVTFKVIFPSGSILIFLNVFLGFSGGPYGISAFEGPLAKRSRGRFRSQTKQTIAS